MGSAGGAGGHQALPCSPPPLQPRCSPDAGTLAPRAPGVTAHSFLASINLHFQNCSCSFFFLLIFTAVWLLLTFSTFHSCFPMLSPLPPHSKVNRLYTHIYTLPSASPSHTGHHSALVPGATRCILIKLPILYISTVYVSLPSPPTPPFSPLGVHTSVL